MPDPSWDFGIAVTSLHESRPIASFASSRATTARYIRTTRADVAELAAQPGAVLDRLVGQLARAMYSEGYIKLLVDARRDLPS